MVSRVIALAVSAMAATPAFAVLQSGCANVQYSGVEVAAAITNSTTAGPLLHAAACDFGAAAQAESGGNTCSTNGSNFGILQLSSTNLPYDITAEQYLALSLQEQVDVWALQVGNANSRGGYEILFVARASGDVGGAVATSGMLAACFQFGPAICSNDVEFMKAHGGQCPAQDNGGININSLPRHRWREANLDGNAQSICSWGAVIQHNITQLAGACAN
jgi:hypothetical protein